MPAKKKSTSRRKAKTAAASAADGLAWWREARFGMFIHWGLYALPAGMWRGRPVDGPGEWIMSRARIPRHEYSKLAARFNPALFNAHNWVRVAKDAGAKYIVVTAKHHDGFAMFASEASKYNIVQATPFARDPMKELASACREAGLKLCFYYSQTQDWHDPNALGNNWDFSNKQKPDFARYLSAKVEPQLTELLKHYGHVGLIWFDTPWSITRAQSGRLARLVHRLQPACLVNSRVGNDAGDYDSMGDNQVPAGRAEGDWETPATINDSWGFKEHDRNWRPADRLLRQLVDVASKGGNYLLNVGPTAEGLIPAESVERLAQIGWWMRVNGEAVHGTRASPYPCAFRWGRMTYRPPDREKGEPAKLYLLFFEWPRTQFILQGLRNKVTDAYLLARGREKVHFSQSHLPDFDIHLLELDLRLTTPDQYVSVVALELAGKADVDQTLLEQPDGSINMPAHAASLPSPRSPKQQMRVDRGGVTENWISTSGSLSWKFRVARPRKFDVRVITSATGRPPAWHGGHKISVAIGRKSFAKVLKADEEFKYPYTGQCTGAATLMGRIKLEGGTYGLTLKVTKFNSKAPGGLAVSEVELIPAE